jgi:hypothetical protein
LTVNSPNYENSLKLRNARNVYVKLVKTAFLGIFIHSLICFSLFNNCKQFIFIIRASEGTLSHWSRLHLHPLQFQGGLTSGRRPVVKIIAESLSQHDEKHVVPTPLSGIRVGGRKQFIYQWLYDWHGPKFISFDRNFVNYD